MTLQELNNLSLDDRIFQVIERLVDFSSVPVGESSIWLEDGETKYDQIRLYQGLAKPTLEQVEAEFLVYKQELIALEQARLDEEIRVENITSRFNALKDLHYVVYQAGYIMENPALELPRIILENDVARLSEYEAISSQVESKINQQKINEEARKYLASTDWVIVKCIERGLPIPGDIANARQQARDRVID